MLLETACELCKRSSLSMFWALYAKCYIQYWIFSVVLLGGSCQLPVVHNSCDWCRRNIEDMLRIPWHVAVFDEAHKLKNRNAKIHEACCQLDTKLRYGLTGTAMQVPAVTQCCCIVVPSDYIPSIEQKLYRYKKRHVFLSTILALSGAKDVKFLNSYGPVSEQLLLCGLCASNESNMCRLPELMLPKEILAYQGEF